MAFNMFPWTNLHNLNTDWILNTIKTLKSQVESTLEQVTETLEQVTGSLANAVLYISQSHNETDRKQACSNIHAVSYDNAPLSSENAAQARTNIGAVSSSDIPDISNVVTYSVQSPTSEQKTVARNNIGAASKTGLDNLELAVAAQSQTLNDCVRFTAQTGQTDAQKAQARNNIGAISAADIPPAASAVLYTRQTLTDAQKGVARDNIKAEEYQPWVNILNETENVYATTYDYDVALGAITGDRPVWMSLYPYGSTVQYLGVARASENGDGMEADLFNTMVGPGQGYSTIWYHVYWHEVSDVPTLSVSKVEGRMVPSCSSSDAGKYLMPNNLGVPQWRSSPAVVSDSQSSSITLPLPVADTIYEYGELTALTISDIPATGDFIIRFRSGSTPTTTNFPQTMLFPSAFTPAANTRYEINVSNKYALAVGWA